ncbi:MAG: histone deacetylase [Armatimonadota bacterium]|nr:histone deacetylase [Armatimonadota bacterium]MDR7439638.1 histone deacetylase [Armatimonadota bacterium]MDR7566764.1 histone deacetylase [Armatimonadota bacterium]MDR7601300.1 histone deacetylase [Armatimonadota bacterium]
MRFALVMHPDCRRHRNPPGHPERQERLEAIERVLQRVDLWERLSREEPEPLPPEALLAVHSRTLVERIQALDRAGGGQLDPDTYVCEGSWAALLAAAGAAVHAAEAVTTGRLHRAFALLRPPGHHATPTRAMGFCLVNHLSLAARLMMDRHPVDRVMIVDWDVHHGNGTQEIFYRDGRVLFISLHQEFWYPGTGRVEEVGAGEGEGFTVNVPLPPGTGEGGYRTVFEEIVLPLGDAFRPQLVFLSAGFDAHQADSLGRMALVSASFGRLCGMLVEGAQRWCEGRMVGVLEGGYDLNSLGWSVAHTLSVLAGEALGSAPAEPVPRECPYATIQARVREVRGVLRHYWAI